MVWVVIPLDNYDSHSHDSSGKVRTEFPQLTVDAEVPELVKEQVEAGPNSSRFGKLIQLIPWFFGPNVFHLSQKNLQSCCMYLAYSRLKQSQSVRFG